MRGKCELAIVDDISPHPISGFRYEEFTSILKNITGSKLYTTGQSVHVLGTASIQELVDNYRKKHPIIGEAVEILTPESTINAKLLYCVFLLNADWNVVERAETEKTPFMFTLYPGGLFALNNEKSDSALSKVLSSPYFKKVIVTQKVTYDYLINKGFCTSDKIEYIWGVVVPSHKLNMTVKKKYYGINKKTLDICFVAHKYSEHGEDKGYDVFLAVAKKLSEKYDNTRFHVVGPWDESILSTEGINNLTYYGTQNQDWFDVFYRDKDILLSPNIDSKIFEGSFDGFPTGAATDASLRKVAMFITDPLSLNDGHFVDGEEIVIIKHDPDDIVNKIEYYMNDPSALRDVCEAGYKKTNTLYSYERQIEPRLKILRQMINEPFEPPRSLEETQKPDFKHKAWAAFKRRSPLVVKKAGRRLKKIWAKKRSA